MNARVLLVVALVLAYSSSATARDRKGYIIDSEGNKVEVSNLHFDRVQGRFDEVARKMVYVLTTPFQIAIDMNMLKSLKDTGKVDADSRRLYEAIYVQAGKEETIIGPLQDCKLLANGRSGKVEVWLSKIKEIVLQDAPAASRNTAREEFLKANQAMLFLKDGTKVRVQGLQRTAEFYSTEGFVIGGTTHHPHYSDFQFVPDRPLEAVHFRDLKSYELTDDGNVSLTLRTGEVRTEPLPTKKGTRIDGFTGVKDVGDFYIPADLVKKIEFDPWSVKKTSKRKRGLH